MKSGFRSVLKYTPAWVIRRIIVMKGEHHTNQTVQQSVVIDRYFQQLYNTPGGKKRDVPVVIGMVGLIGSGKTTTARMLADGVDAKFIHGDTVRLMLREAGEGYEGTRKVVETVAEAFALSGTSVVIDTDHVDYEKRVALQDALSETNARVLFVRCTADPDVQFSRIRNADYRTPNIFTVAAPESTSIASDAEVDVRLRELWRRTPRHYEWHDTGGGIWRLRDMPFAYATIDTTERKNAEEQVEKLIEELA